MGKNNSSYFGLFLGLSAIIGSFLIEGGSIKALFLVSPLIIVFGGTFAAVIIGFGFEKFKLIFPLWKIAYNPEEYDPSPLIEDFARFSIRTRQFGMISIEDDVKEIKSSFAKKLLNLMMVGTDDEVLENIAYTEMKSLKERHYLNISIFSKMGSYAPTMGILGTVMALIMTLANAGSEPELLIQSIATAFIATLWGVFSANIIWLPIADKLKKCHIQEQHMMEVTLEGVLALKKGEIPSMIKSRMASMLPQKEQEKILGYS